MTRLPFLLCLVLAPLCGCSSPGVEFGDLSGNTRTIGDADEGIELEQERISYGDNDLAISTVPM